MAITKEQEAYLRSLEDEKSDDARARAARFGRFTRRAAIVAPSSAALTVRMARAAGQSNPVAAGPVNFTATFSAPATGFTNSDVSFSGSTVGGTLAAAVTGTGPYNIAVTGMTGNGLVMVSIPAGAATDASGNPFPASNMSTVTLDTTAPTVTINQAVGQADTTQTSPINFTAIFNEAVSGFANSDISFTGSTAGGTLAAVVTGSGTTYNVAVTGMTTAGNVVASIPAGAATDLAGNLSLASTSTDNTVVWDVDTTGPTVSITQAAGQTDPTTSGPINFTVTFSEPVTGFTAGDVNLSGSTATGSIAAIVTGSGSTYNVSVSGMTTSGFVVIDIPAGAATDLAGNPSLAFSTPASFGSQGTYLTYATHVNSVLPAPPGIANGDLLIAYLLVGGAVAPATPTPPAGWSTLAGSPIATTVGGFSVKYNVFYKFASSEAGSYTFTHASASSCGLVIRYTGVDATTPFSPTPTTANGTGVTATATGFTTTVANTLVIFTEQDWGDTATDTVVPPGTTPTFTERVDQALLYIADGPMVAPGATGNKAHTSNTLGTGGWTAYLIGLKPSSGAVGGDNTVTFDAGASAGFPDATNTGVPVGTSLAASGNITTTSNGQIIDARNISGIVRIRHNNVTLKRCRITSDDGIIVECDAGLPTGLIVEDCTIVGVGGAGQTAFNPDGGGGGSIIRRCNISNVENAIGIGENAQQIRDNYIHDLFQSESAHTDGIQGTGGFTSLTIDHNSIFGVDTSCIILQNEGGGFSGAIINNNQLVMTNGSAAIYCRSDKGPGAVDNITITNNKLGKASGGGYNSIVGVTNLTYTGNTDWQTAVPVASTD